jgi:hypothetical protein
MPIAAPSRNRRDHADMQIAQPGQALQDLGNPQSEPVTSGLTGEHDERELPDSRVNERAAQPHAVPRFCLCLLGSNARTEPRPLLTEPAGLLRMIGEIEEGHDPEYDCRSTLDQEQPLPAGKSEKPVHLQ